MPVQNFTLAGYRATLETLIQRGYEVVGFGECDPAARHLILRHDLDMSIDAALQIAEIESSLSVKAHYFILLRTEMYNAWSDTNCNNLRRIGALGHEIGLHFDASLYPDDPEMLDQSAAQECQILESMIGSAVETISFHRPAPQFLGRQGPIGGRRHTYQPRFYSDMGYCSDSRGAWHHGPPLDHPAIAEGRALQLLTHPIWWSRSAALGPVEALDQFRDVRDGVLEIALAENCEPYRNARAKRASTSKRNDE